VFQIAFSASAATIDERNAQREIRKLEPLPKEQLSSQSLVDIYTACIRLALAQTEKNRTKTFTRESLQQSCQEERQNLAKKITPDSVNGLDNFFVTTFNEAARKAEIREEDS